MLSNAPSSMSTTLNKKGQQKPIDMREEEAEPYLMIVIVDSHLKIETSELCRSGYSAEVQPSKSEAALTGQMTMRVGVFSSEDGPDLIDALHVSSDSPVHSTHPTRQPDSSLSILRICPSWNTDICLPS